MNKKIFRVSTNLSLKDYDLLGFIFKNISSNYYIGYAGALSLIIKDYLSRYSLDKFKAENINLSQIKEDRNFKFKSFGHVILSNSVRGEISEEHFILINHLKYLCKISTSEILRRIISVFRKMYKNDKDNQNMMINLNRIFKEYKNGKC